jgi:hypothetical protein
MSVQSSHQTSIVVTPATLKHQIITRLNTLVSKSGGAYYPTDDSGYTKPLVEIEGMEVHGLETKGRDVYLMTIPTDETAANNMEDDYLPYNANEFYLEQLWEIYLGCEPIYQSKFNDYGSIQD